MSELTRLLSDLVAIDSVNPDLVPGAKGEGEIARFIADWLRRAGLEVTMEDTGKPGRPNVIGVARGTGGGRSLLLNSHMDTVGVAGMTAPFVPEVRDGRLYGRGALDTKAALAAFMAAAAGAAAGSAAGTPAAGARARRGDVIVTAVMDEEYASVGTETAARGWKADAAIVGEPTGLEIVIAHKGFLWFEVETRGKAAHGSLPDVGVDAIAKMGRVLVAIDEMAARLSKVRAHPLLRAGSIHASLVSGGQELSSYPSSCRLGIERRTIPGESPDEIERELRAVLDSAAATDPSFSATLKRTFMRNPLEVPRDLPIVQALAAQVRAVTGREPVYNGMAGWMDSALLADAGIPAVIFGPSGEGLHGEVEWVDLESVETCARVVSAVIGDYCA